MKWIQVKPIVNRKNGQINISLPKKELTPKQINDIHDKKRIEIVFKKGKL